MGHYLCPACRKTYPLEEAVWRCSCGSYLDYIQEKRLQKTDIIPERTSLWRYEKVLPLTYQESKASFAEGLTPLVKKCWSGIDICFKLDYLMPSGSFKDRGSAVLINYLARLGIERIIEDSSGNAGASIAAYCAAAGIGCEIYVPAATSPAKLVQIAMAGARLKKIRGSREDTADAALQEAEQGFYGSHNWHPLFIEGTKTAAYELWEQSGFAAPDKVVLPVGMGSSLLGLFQGFRELQEAGEIKKLPQLLGIQAENCAPLYYRERGQGEQLQKSTIAEGIACASPLRSREILRAVRETGGCLEAVKEAEIAAALKKGALTGFYIEPTAAAALAGLDKLLSRERIRKGERVVVMLTGSGLKATEEIAEICKLADN